MPQEERQIFREQSLEKLSSPDRLDEMLRIVNPPTWILLGAVGVGMALVLAWGILGRIPASVDGTAILVRPKQVVGFQSRATGPVKSIEVLMGDEVEKGKVLARVHLPGIQKLLDQERAKLVQFTERSSQLTDLERKLARQERTLIDEQLVKLAERIEGVRVAADRALANDREYIHQQRINVETTGDRVVELQEKLREQLQSLAGLRKDRLVSRSDEIDAQRQLIESDLRLAELQVTKSEIDLREGISQENHDSQMDLIKDLEIQVDSLELRKLEIESELKTDEIVNATELDEINRRIDELQAQLENEGDILSEFSGKVIEITVTQGQLVSIGQRIGKLEIEDPEAGLQALAYFRIKDGKKLEKDLAIRISPATVERERFGAILGKVDSVSVYPVTTEAVANQIGDLELARRLIGAESSIEVLANLDPDPRAPTGFAWTSGHGPPDVAITAGTTAQVRVTIEERAPITLLLPFLKSLSGS